MTKPGGNRGHVLGVLIAALFVAEVSKDVLFSTDRGDWYPACMFLYYGMIAGLPFLLAIMAPKAASFETQWLPGSRWHWLWFVGMALLVIVSKLLVATLTFRIAGRISPTPFFGPVTPTGVIFLGIAAVFIGPVAEEIFFRGYVLDQLRKLTHSGVALLIQSLLFGLFHLFARGLFTPLALFAAVNTFMFGMIFGAWRIKFRSLLPLVLAHVLLNAIATIAPLKSRYDQATGNSAPIRHTVSEETTYITEPLRADGSVDYVAALNQQQREGVTPKNNAAVLFWKAVGPEEILPEYRTKYFGMLGIWPLREKGDYFVSLDHFIDRRQHTGEASDTTAKDAARWDAWDRLNLARQRPWTSQEFPVLAEWIAVNEKPLSLLVEASKRPRRYDPLCCRVRTALMGVPFPAGTTYREVARAFCARATLRLGEGRLDEAWGDLLACHRLARLAGQCPTLIETLTAFAVEGTACDGDRALLQHARLSAAQIAKMREDLDQLPPMPRMVDKLDAAERFTYLDVLSDFSRQGTKSVTEFYDGLVLIRDDAFEELGNYDELENTVNMLIQYGETTAIDWDLILRMGNSWYDRIVEAYRMPTAAEKRKTLRKIAEDLRRLKKSAANADSLAESMRDDPGKAFSERFGQILLTFFTSDPQHYLQVENRGTMRFELDKLGFALASYRAEHGVYPAKLADLVPDYVARVPVDTFTGSELRYRRDGNGYLLYSFGANGKSDGGRGYEDHKNQEDWDDLVLRVPAPAATGAKR